MFSGDETLLPAWVPVVRMAFPPLGMLAFLSLFVVAGLAVAGVGISKLQALVQMVRIDGETVTDVSTGPAEVEGTPSALDDTLEAPFTGTECVAYEVEVERYRHDDDGSNWHSVEEGDESVPFEIRDGTGSVRVDASDATLSLEDSYQEVVDRDERPPERIEEFLAGVDVEHDTGSFEIGPIDVGTGDKHRFTERRLEAGGTAYVLGVAGYDYSVSTDLTFGAAEGRDGVLGQLLGHPFVVADAGESATRKRMALGGLGLLLFGAFFAGVPLLMILGGT